MSPASTTAQAPTRFDRETVGTRYIVLPIRTLVDPTNPEDLKQVHALQDAIKVEQPGGPARSRCPTGIKRARRRCATLCSFSAPRCPTSRRRSERKDQVDPVRHLIGTAAAGAAIPTRMRRT